MSMSPSQKFGMETPIKAANIETESIAEYCLAAEIVPSGIPRAMAKMSAEQARTSVLGNLASISADTGYLVEYEIPKSP